ncbi:MAG: hypothetical protein Q8P54_02540, partial [bacterium]|nr:hypothetical protein [bacterium]
MERRLRLRDIFFYLILIIITVFLIINFNQLQKFSALLAGLNIFILSLILIVRFFSYWANTRYFESFFKLFDGNKIGFKRLFITTIVMNFINTILPSGGISGTSYLIKATEPEVKASTATIAQISWYVL